MAETRYERIAREQAERQAQRQARAKHKPRQPRRKRGWQPDETPYGQGDNLGESLD